MNEFAKYEANAKWKIFYAKISKTSHFGKITEENMLNWFYYKWHKMNEWIW